MPQGSDDSERGGDRFDDVGHQIAEVLRVATEEARGIRALARDESQRLLDVARTEIEAMRTQAQLDADRIRAEAEAERDEAKRLLVRARERADQLQVEAEAQAARVINEAGQQARDRVAAELESGQAHLQRLARDEQRTRERLLRVQAELQQVVDRLADPSTLIDLTVEPAVHRPPVGGAASPASGDGHRDDRPTAAPTGAPDQLDPLAVMVRGAVDRAVAHSPRTPPPRPSNAPPADG